MPLGAPDLHGALLHMGQRTLLASGQIGVGPGQGRHLVKGVLLSCILYVHNGRAQLPAVVNLHRDDMMCSDTGDMIIQDACDWRGTLVEAAMSALSAGENNGAIQQGSKPLSHPECTA